MTGINGKNNKSKNVVVLFDSSVPIEQIKSIQKQDHDQITIISLDYKSYTLLEKYKIPSIPSDQFLTYDEMKQIQNSSYILSDWHTQKKIEHYLIYKNVNLGSLIQAELINVLVNYLKKFFTIYKIIQKFHESHFLCSRALSNILKIFSDDFSILHSTKTVNEFPLDSINTNVELTFKSLNLKLKLDTKSLKMLKSLTENISKPIIRSKMQRNSKSYLFAEINIKKFSALFKKMPNFESNYVVYNRRQPSIWDKESFFILKNSNAVLENEKTLHLNKKSILNQNKSLIKNIVQNLKNHDEFFSEFFVIETLSFWSTFKSIFYALLEKRLLDYSYEIELSEQLLSNHAFNGILLQNEIGPHEQILIQIGKANQIPILLLQHGLIFDTTEASMMNKYQGVLGQNSDYQLVWGDVDYQYRKKLGHNSNKVIKIGSPIYENVPNVKNSKKDYILLATSGPTTEDIFDLSNEIIIKNIRTIEDISKIVLSLNQKLIVKIHPSPDEFDPTELLHNIDPNIKVIKTGNIADLITNCSMMIVVDFSSVILDGYLQQKPIISIHVKENDYGMPTAFTNDSCSFATTETLEEKIKSLLTDDSQLIKNGTISAKNYLFEPEKSSNRLLSFLSKIN